MCITDACLVSWHGFECVVTDCFGCNDGTWVGTEAYTSCGTPCCVDTAGVFNGGSITRVTLNDASYDFMNANSAFSITTWVKSCISSEQGLVTKSTQLGASDSGWALANIVGGTERVQFIMKCICFNNGIVRACGSGIGDGNWHHIALTKAATSNTDCTFLYFDGALATCSVFRTCMFFGGTNNRSATIGATESGSRAIVGQMDETNIWSRQLTACDISRLYNKGSGIKYVDLPFCFPPPPDAPSVTANVLTRGITATIYKRGDTAYKI